MITLFIFYVHVVAAVVIFTKRWQDGGLKEGLLALGFLALIFSVGWSISTFILKLFIDEKGFGIWLDRDALSLTLLLILESVFFYFQLKQKKRKLKTV
ncbi:MAG: hypothetical protein QME52_07790 [Bacteroidota bacterium]|nr:hypothetical protein [Bacteroidota bacterium]